MNHFKWHGMIIFDETQVHKSRKVDSKTMTYVGLTQEAGDDAGELADHVYALFMLMMFMLCPFGDSYAQPIGVSAAKNATKGSVLAQLLLQAVVLMEQAGGKIHGFVYNGASTNTSTMWNTLGINGELERSCN